MGSFVCASKGTLVEWRVEAERIRLLDAGFRAQMRPLYGASGTRRDIATILCKKKALEQGGWP